MKSNKMVKDCMTRDADYIKPETTLKEAAEKMLKLDTGSLPVGDGEKLLGFITDRDITVRAVAKGLDPKNTRVDKVMTNKVLYCFENQSLEDVAENMMENRILRLVVLDDDKMFKGVITHSDISKATENNDNELSEKVVGLACFGEAA
jgi:CBS domain-containing protein